MTGTSDSMFRMSMGAMAMIVTCLYSIALIIPVQLQLSRRNVWNLDVWLVLFTIQMVFALLAVAWAIVKGWKSRMAYQTIGDHGGLAANFAFMTLYAVAAFVVFIRLAVLRSDVNGQYRVNVLEVAAARETVITQFEVDLREVLNSQTFVFQVATASIATFLYGLILTTVGIPKHLISKLTDVTVSGHHHHHESSSKKSSSSHKKGKKSGSSKTDSGKHNPHKSRADDEDSDTESD